MGVGSMVMITMAIGSMTSAHIRIKKNSRCKTYTPRGRRGTGLRPKDDGGADLGIS
jgi:hypothetical protein